MKLLLCDLMHTASRTANYWVLLRHNMNFYQCGLTRRRPLQKLAGEVGIIASSCCHRNLTTAQRALIALGFLEYEKAEAKKRQGARTDIPENFPECSFKDARDQAGDRMHVSGKSVDAAGLRQKAIPQVFSFKLDIQVRFFGAVEVVHQVFIRTARHQADGRILLALRNRPWKAPEAD